MAAERLSRTGLLMIPHFWEGGASKTIHPKISEESPRRALNRSGRVPFAMLVGGLEELGCLKADFPLLATPLRPIPCGKFGI